MRTNELERMVEDGGELHNAVKFAGEFMNAASWARAALAGKDHDEDINATALVRDLEEARQRINDALRIARRVKTIAIK